MHEWQLECTIRSRIIKNPNKGNGWRRLELRQFIDIPHAAFASKAIRDGKGKHRDEWNHFSYYIAAINIKEKRWKCVALSRWGRSKHVRARRSKKKANKKWNSQFHLEEIYQIIIVCCSPCNGWCLRCRLGDWANLARIFRARAITMKHKIRSKKRTHNSHNNHKKLYLRNNSRILSWNSIAMAAEASGEWGWFRLISPRLSIYLEI